jgi:hypothetical protein
MLDRMVKLLFFLCVEFFCVYYMHAIVFCFKQKCWCMRIIFWCFLSIIRQKSYRPLNIYCYPILGRCTWIYSAFHAQFDWLHYSLLDKNKMASRFVPVTDEQIAFWQKRRLLKLANIYTERSCAFAKHEESQKPI